MKSLRDKLAGDGELEGGCGEGKVDRRRGARKERDAVKLHERLERDRVVRSLAHRIASLDTQKKGGKVDEVG